MKERYLAFEKSFSYYCKRHSITILRTAMGIIYFWYGLLKVLGISPAEELVYYATQWIGVHDFVIFLGVWEMLIGICFFLPKFLRVGLLLFFFHLPGTFLPIFLNPEDVYTFIPFALTLEGQYIFKNLVFIAGALVLVGSLHQDKEKIDSSL